MLPRGLLREYSRPLSMVLRALDVSAVVIAGLGIYFYKFEDINLSQQYITALLAAAMLTIAVFSFFRVYESVRGQGFWQHISHLTQAMFTLWVLLAGLAFLTKTGEVFSRAWFMSWAVSAFVLLIMLRCGLLIVLRFMRSHGLNERRIIIIGAEELGVKLAETVQEALWTGFRIVTIFDDHPQDKPDAVCGIPVQQMPQSLQNYIANSSVTIDEIWLALPLQAEGRAKKILHELRHEMITTRFVLDVFGIDFLSHSITDFAGFPMLNIRSTPMIGMNRIIKAIEDRILASIILLFASPIFLITAMAVKFSSPGPIFYRQKRVGWNGEEFEMLKFRTMPVDAEATTGPVWAQAGEDARYQNRRIITPNQLG